MKKLLYILLFYSIVSFGQDSIQKTEKISSHEAYFKKIYEVLMQNIAQDRYVVYRTENIYTSLLLDTQTGRVWQVQIGTNNSDAMKTVLSDSYLSYDKAEMKRRYESDLKEWENTPAEDRWYTKPTIDGYKQNLGKIGQYKMYPTENMYNFIMIDTETGWTYQVQWNIDRDKRILNSILKY